MFEHEQWRTFEAHQQKNNQQYSTPRGTNIFIAACGRLKCLETFREDEILKRLNYSVV